MCPSLASGEGREGEGRDGDLVEREERGEEEGRRREEKGRRTGENSEKGMR
jgi:hypothetical protein